MTTILTATEWNAGLAPQTHLSRDELTWRADGSDDDPRSVLRAVLSIAGTRHTLIAIAVHLEMENPDAPLEPIRLDIGAAEAEGKDCQIVADREDIYITELYQAHRMNGACQTVEIESRHYAVFMHPFSE